MLKKILNKRIGIIFVIISIPTAIWFFNNYPKWVIRKGEALAFQTLIDILLVQSEFTKRAILDNNNNEIGEYADFESLLKSNIVIRDLNWDL